MLTKGELIDGAFGDIGLASYVFDIEPEEQEAALRQLDSMVATWSIKGINIGYQLSSSTSDSSINQVSGVPQFAIEAIEKNLALRLAPKYNKQVSLDLKAQAKEAYNALLTAISIVPEMQNTSILPIGSGNRFQRNINNVFYQQTDDLEL